MKQAERYIDEQLRALAHDGQVHVVHDKDQKYTLSYIIEGVTPSYLIVHSGIAFCNIAAGDNFCKSEGRTYSKRRVLEQVNRGSNHAHFSKTLIIERVKTVPSSAAEWRKLDNIVTGALAP